MIEEVYLVHKLNISVLFHKIKVTQATNTIETADIRCHKRYHFNKRSNDLEIF